MANVRWVKKSSSVQVRCNLYFCHLHKIVYLFSNELLTLTGSVLLNFDYLFFSSNHMHRDQLIVQVVFQIKAKCQASENKLTGPDKRCFVSLTVILKTLFLKFGETIYRKTPSNTFVPICNFNKPISATQCFVETNDIVIDPVPEYFNDNISPCDSNACLTCNSFISDQSFKSNLTGRIYKTQTYEQLTCGLSNVVYAIHCV